MGGSDDGSDSGWTWAYRIDGKFAKGVNKDKLPLVEPRRDYAKQERFRVESDYLQYDYRVFIGK